MKFRLKKAEEVRLSQTQKSLKEIRTLYRRLAKQTKKRIEQLGEENINKPQLLLLQRDLNKRIEELNEQLEGNIKGYIVTTANAVVKDTREFLKDIGFKKELYQEAFYYVPDDVLRNIVNGNIYQKGWSLSDALWDTNRKIRKDIQKVITEGATQGKSAYDVAKDLEKYVNPDARKDWNWSKVYPNTNKVIDYNAQRLARTMISHAYQQSFETTNEYNPFCKDYIWHSANIHGRTCEICKERDGKHFKKDSMPLDHPNGMCTFEAYIPKSMTEIADQIGEWYNSPTGTFPEIDTYAERF